MKNILLTNFLFIAVLTNAQFQKGDKYSGGTFSTNVQSVLKNPNGIQLLNSFGIDPFIGFIINEKYAIGGQIGYSCYHEKFTNIFSSTNEHISKSVSAGVHARRYFKISKKFLFSVVAPLGFSRGVDTSIFAYPPQQGTSENKTQEYRLWTGIVPGFMFFPTPKWGFEASVGGINLTHRRNLSTHATLNDFDFRYGTISFGIAYYFRNQVNKN